MAELRLAGNFIDITGPLGYGHLQIVFVNDNGTQLENEVQVSFFWFCRINLTLGNETIVNNNII